MRITYQGIRIPFCSLRTKTSNKGKNDCEVTGHIAVNSARRCRKKKSPSTLARSQDTRIKRFLDKKSSGKPDLASPKGRGITAVLCEQETVDSLWVKELETTSLACGGESRDLKSLDIPTSAPTSFDLVKDQRTS